MRMMLALVLVLFSLIAEAEITAQSEQHFVIKHQFTASEKKPLATVYQQFVRVQDWWEADHTFTGFAEHLYFDFDQQRCFCEKIPGGGFVEHLGVAHVIPQYKVVFSGGLGPLQDHAVNGKLIWTFKHQDGKVVVNVEYRVFGYIEGGMGEWPKAVDFVLATQVKKLSNLLQ